jgi:hypothetical protein
MFTYFPSMTDAPVTMLMASATVPAPARPIVSALMALLTAAAFARSLSSPASVSRAADASMTTSSSCAVCSASVISTREVSPVVTSIPVTVLS